MSRISEIIKSNKQYEYCTLAERMKDCRTNAISIALVENLEICETYTHGVKRRGKTDKVTVDTIFQAASISKPVFAAAVMQLVERGTLDIDTDISKYLVGYEVPAYDNVKHRITLKQVLSHNAGLSLHGFEGYQQGQQVPTIEQILNGAPPSNHLKLKLLKKPETGYQYSGGGYVLAQKVVTDVCKRDFCELMNELVLSPLSMTRSTFSQPLLSDKLSEIAYGYNPHDLEVPGGYDIMPELSAAGLWSTPSDLARLGIEVMKGLNNESAYLKKDTAMLMTTRAYENSGHGIGFVIDDCKKGPTFGHDGYNDGFVSSMSFCPYDGSGIVVMVNSNIGIDIISEVVNAFKEVYGW